MVNVEQLTNELALHHRTSNVCVDVAGDIRPISHVTLLTNGPSIVLIVPDEG